MSAISSLLLQLNRGVWAIEPNSANAFYPVVSSILRGEKRDFSMMMPSNNRKVSNQIISINADNLDTTYYGSIEEATTDCISILHIVGAIMKYDYCDSIGTISMGEFLREADSNINVIAHLLVIDSPGGAADGTLNLSETIKSLNKPVYVLINGMCCSAAYWIASACKEIYCSNILDQTGSIGTYIRLRDYSEQLKNDGIREIDIYADKSTDKNRDTIEALKGNDKLIKDNLINPFNEAFLSSVKTNRSTKPKFNEEMTLTGKVFLTADAIKYGLVDGKKTMEELLIYIIKNNKNGNN